VIKEENCGIKGRLRIQEQILKQREDAMAGS
jgi:hypothetical protein